ncbi:MAG: amidohydrolase [bacterium]|nr:MAG: amidohydrolase [bacterium]
MNNFDCKTLEKKVEEVMPDLIQLRRNLHQEPELGWLEYRTTEKIIEFLNKYKIDRIFRPLKTGLVAEIINHPDSPFIGIRADIDGLPIPDEKSVDYRSRCEGISHACGHDFHTAVVCGLAAIIQSYRRDLKYNLRFIFQPAEEPIPSGAPRMIEKGVLKDIQTIWTWHVEPALPLGTIGLMSGWVNAQSIKLDWEIKGKAGHSARPGLAHNPISAASYMVQKIEDYFAELGIHHKFPAVMAFTKIQSRGDAYNAIPEQAEVGGTLRITEPDKKDLYTEIMQDITQHTEKKYGVHVASHILVGSPPVLNDASIVGRFLQNLEKLKCKEFEIVKHERSMGGEDFGWYSMKVPSALVRFGTALEGKAPAVHTGLFDAPEEIISFAVSFFLHQILQW